MVSPKQMAVHWFVVRLPDHGWGLVLALVRASISARSTTSVTSFIFDA